MPYKIAEVVFSRVIKRRNIKKSNRAFHVASSYANLLEKKKVFTGLAWDANMAAVSLFCDTNCWFSASNRSK